MALFTMTEESDHSPYEGIPKERRKSSPDELLVGETLQIERKTFIFSLKENPRGKFLRITEDVGGRRDTIIIPSTGLQAFRDVLSTMAEACAGDEPVGEPEERDSNAD